ncbi:MAG TPA: rhodanese-like domain-containing protein [Anaerolineae bacterium]|nr:rhodanese-like domain-containing protein [Anaerolineae bacterium]
MPSSKIVVLVLLIATALAACQAQPTPTSVSAPTPVLTQRANGGDALPLTREDVPRIALDELRDLLASPRKIVVIDTRSGGEYEAGHIRGAISMPSAEVESRYRELPRGSKIVLYCA